MTAVSSEGMTPQPSMQMAFGKPLASIPPTAFDHSVILLGRASVDSNPSWVSAGIHPSSLVELPTVNACLFGVVSQQFYSYWRSGEFCRWSGTLYSLTPLQLSMTRSGSSMWYCLVCAILYLNPFILAELLSSRNFPSLRFKVLCVCSCFGHRTLVEWLI